MEETISFEDLGLNEETLAAVAAKGFEQPSPIQVLAIPRLLNGDANIIAKARTGTGKTAAFGIPLVQTIKEDKGKVCALVLTPTRELALQVSKEIDSLHSSKFPRIASVYGGAGMGEQLRALRRGVEIVVGTPGRVKDHLERGSLNIANIDYFILDEADEMLDMGFIEDIEEIFSQANPNSRVLLFSATMPQPILNIASRFMGDYEIVEEEARPEEPVLTEQRYWVVRESEKINALVRLIDISEDFYGLIFTQTKADADMVTKELDDRGYQAAALHGDIAQIQREKILARFRSKKTRILVATDVAARGIDVTGLTHVVNYAMPFDGPTYIHRIGRTGRAGARGMAFTLVRPEERRKINYLKKVSGGNLEEAEIPSIDEVLNAKKKRLFDETLRKLGLFQPEKTDVDFEDEIEESEVVAEEPCANLENEVIVSSEHEPLNEETASFGEVSDSLDDLIDNAGEDGVEIPKTIEVAEPKEPKEPKKPMLKAASKDFVEFAEKICADQDPRAVVAALLEEQFGEQLDRSRYGNVNTFSGAPLSKQIRLYVGLGRRDGMGRPEIARFFSDLLHIPGRLVDRIEVTENFSLASLPPDAAMRALDMAKRDRGLPHMHIDTKSNDFAEVSGKRGGRNFQGGKRFDRPFRPEREGRGDRGERRGGFDRGSRRDGGSRRSRQKEMMPMQYRTSNASLYKKHKNCD
ncbi:MAG: DEAD/DEAH box helicase [Spirochaetaceae bacterium]|nr:DEAD/DEAH box helicase [Spirochaetaceae bacterium]